MDTSQTKIAEIQIGNNLSYVITRFQFLVQLVPTYTIHHAQGLTLEYLTFDPVKVIKHSLTYIKLSKICSKENLYLFCLLSNNFFQIDLTVKKEMAHFRIFGKYELKINHLNNYHRKLLMI